MTAATFFKAAAWRKALQQLSPKQRQFAMLAAILFVGVGVLWLVFAFSGDDTSASAAAKAAAAGAPPSSITNIGVMPPGQQVNPVDQWVGTAGRKLAEYEHEREEQSRLNKDRSAFEARTMQRFAELEQRLITPAQPAPGATPAPAATLPPAPAALPPPAPMQSVPARAPSGTPPAGSGVMPPGFPPGPGQFSGDSFPRAPEPASPVLTRIQIAPPSGNTTRPGGAGSIADAATGSGIPGRATRTSQTLESFLPVSFTRGQLLGGLDAPTGGQSQSNPHPVLIRLTDNSVLPNRFRAAYRECFVVAAGYGDISSERAYLRTESLSCVRADGHALEVRIQGTVHGEDGKVGLRGRLVSKQGQLLANALMAGIISGIGQGVSTASTSYSTSALGTIASSTGSEAYRAGMGTGVGRALDRLAQYYIKLAEATFPVIEIDASRQVDVVITKGVRIDTEGTGGSTRTATGGRDPRPSDGPPGRPYGPAPAAPSSPSYYPSPDPDMENTNDADY